MTRIKEKRESLEKFIRAQLIGPGGCNDKYSINDPNVDDIINTTPGSIYSSAILFPEKDGGNDPMVMDGLSDEDANGNIGSLNGDDTQTLDRLYPNKFGVTCCLDGNNLRFEDLDITISGRYYHRVADVSKIILRLTEEQRSDLDNRWVNLHTYLDPYLLMEDDGLRINPKIIGTDGVLDKIKKAQNDLNQSLCSAIAGADPVYLEMTTSMKFLNYYKNDLFKKLSRVNNDGTYLDEGALAEIKNKIAEISKAETICSYLDDVRSMLDSNGFGFWKGSNFSVQIDRGLLQELQVGHYYSPRNDARLNQIKKIEVDKNTTASISAYLQLFQGEGNRVYLKVLVVNDSTPVAEENGRHYSVVTEIVNNRAFFDVKIDVTSPSIINYKDDDLGDIDREATNLNYVYRNVIAKEYGVGHMCSADWGKDSNGQMHVWSEFLPTTESPDVEAVPRNKQSVDGTGNPKPYLSNSNCLQFKWLSTLSDTSNDNIYNGLLQFAESYHDWINQQRLIVVGQTDQEKQEGIRNLDKCEADYNRIVGNIREFLSDHDKMAMFRLMNTAMFIQLWHGNRTHKQNLRALHYGGNLNMNFYRYQNDTDIFPGGSPAAWRPFQLAFILLNLDGIWKKKNDNNWEKRNELVDLVWFPTGGGKTESYLGIIALTIINRRMSFGGSGYGLAAIMRYTLRLLTAQQFQRALRLIMALEYMRRQNLGLGGEQISIGVFVGKGSLPNTKVELVVEAGKDGFGNIPLDFCPWCGAPLKYHPQGQGYGEFRCSTDGCAFSTYNNGLPVRMCDEHIYEQPPTMLLGTVDKFAALARKVDTGHVESDSRRLFGHRAANTTQCLPPDLIIQDELHLLLGPLGSAVALYECAIDQLCTRADGTRPKIISSTATTRNTSLQIRALYDRGVSIFPKTGIDYDDSFFAFYKRHKVGEDWVYDSKRKYMGIMPTGRTQFVTQMRLAAILFVHRAMFEMENREGFEGEEKQDYIKAADYYYSVISYFNSLKEVGRTDAQFHLEFGKTLNNLYRRVFRFNGLPDLFYSNRDLEEVELTGRLSGEQAVHGLSEVQTVSWHPDRRLPFRDENNNWKKGEDPADLILATNMISVGLDVSRFNTIIMNSMPRNIAEYIQASSRVAREDCGLVLTLHNQLRLRDLSHFERFKEFHEKLYYYVEPISITPFSPQAIAKFLPLYLGTIIRHTTVLRNNNQASDIVNANMVDINNLKNDLKQYFVNRKNRLANDDSITVEEKSLLTDSHLDAISKWIDAAIDQWVDKVNTESVNVYSSGRELNQNRVPLFASTTDLDEVRNDNYWVVPMALRVVEPEAVIHVKNN